MSEQDKKQLYPATTTEWADLLDSDIGELRHLRPMLIDTLLEDRPLRFGTVPSSIFLHHRLAPYTTVHAYCSKSSAGDTGEFTEPE